MLIAAEPCLVDNNEHCREEKLLPLLACKRDNYFKIIKETVCLNMGPFCVNFPCQAPRSFRNTKVNGCHKNPQAAAKYIAPSKEHHRGTQEQCCMISLPDDEPLCVPSQEEMSMSVL